MVCNGWFAFDSFLQPQGSKLWDYRALMELHKEKGVSYEYTDSIWYNRQALLRVTRYVCLGSL